MWWRKKMCLTVAVEGKCWARGRRKEREMRKGSKIRGEGDEMVVVAKIDLEEKMTPYFYGEATFEEARNMQSINFDAAIIRERPSCGVGTLVRKKEGIFPARLIERIDGVSNPELAEMLAARRTLELGLRALEPN
ncbi:hypothetical protein ACH5RR_001272 [Cinchona calisaya]|uniref:RNase H type-1 domain-containing protein n=1 Tax=Cinchona calisaya TaxID=153742 RepID=A0ABD3B3I5_9GENT